jgi:catechol 2,3-dioxygenase-like lactoylglutathione lyase family enzyme
VIRPSPFLNVRLKRIARRSTLGSRLLAVTLAWLCFLPATDAAVQEVGSIGITTGRLPDALKFYTNVLPFEVVAQNRIEGKRYADLFNLSRGHATSVELNLGEERILLTEHSTKGASVPPDSRSHDHWFQHIAIVVSDMDKAYEHLRRHKVKHVSTGPQTLPAWNPNAGGIKGFYFMDPEEHVLEIIWFPKGKGDPKWQGQDRLFLGIDHTAIVVSDTEESLRFYTGILGFRIAGESENYGTEQEHLNQVFGARLRITALRAPRGPGIEFLQYIAPPGGRALATHARGNDLAFWTTELVTDSNVDATPNLISRRDHGESVLIRDPDGHALRLRTSSTAFPSTKINTP